MKATLKKISVGLGMIAAVGAGIALPTSAASAAMVPSAHVVPAIGTEFDGFGSGRVASVAIHNAVINADNQATAAGFSLSHCTTIFQGADQPGGGLWVGEDDILCTM